MLSRALVLATCLTVARALHAPTPPCRHAFRVTSPRLATKKKVSKKGGARGFGGGAAKQAVKELTPEQLQWRDLKEWVASSGGAADAVRLTDCGGGLRGLKAARDLAKGDEILRIPRSIILDVERAEASPVSGVWRSSGGALPGYLKLGLALLYEVRRGAASDLLPYLAMLPTQDEFAAGGGPAAMWSDDELALTECAHLIDFAKRRRGQSRGEGVPALQPDALAASWAECGLPGEPPGRDELAWAVGAVTSRAYGVGSGSGLVPVVDMANHDGRTPQHTAKGLEEDGRSFVVLATEPIRKGTQVCLSYGELPNCVLLPQFGFVLASLDAPPDLPLVDFTPCLREAEGAAGGAALLLSLAEDGLLVREGDGSISCWQAAGASLQVALLNLHEAGALSGGGEEEAAAASAPAAARHAWRRYRDLLQGTLAGYSTGVAEDRRRLGLGGAAPTASDARGVVVDAGGAAVTPLPPPNGASRVAAEGEAAAAALPPRTRLALEFRLSQKALLNRALAASTAAGPGGVVEAAARIRFQVLGSRVYQEAVAEEGARVTSSGLVVLHEAEGSGASPTASDRVVVHYEGRNADGIAFDSSYARGDPASFAVGGVIPGWTEGLQLMRVGGKARLTIPSHLGYGDKGSPPKIPAKATLVFTVELLGVE